MHTSPTFSVAGMPLNRSYTSPNSQSHSFSGSGNVGGGGSNTGAYRSSSVGGTHGHIGTGLGGSSTGYSPSFSDGYSLGHSRSSGHYQSGYLNSETTAGAGAGGTHSSHHDYAGTGLGGSSPEIPISLSDTFSSTLGHSRSGLGGFGGVGGHDQSGYLLPRRQRQKLREDDAPPTSSVFDIPNNAPRANVPSLNQLRNNLSESSLRRPTVTTHRNQPQPQNQNQSQNLNHSPKNWTMDRSHSRSLSHSQGQGQLSQQQQQQQQQKTWVIVFGYPIDKYAFAVEYFQSLGQTATDPESVGDVQNCFKIGYADPTEAVRAVTKNGEVLSGTWMVGVSWAPETQIPSEFHSLPPQPSTPTQASSMAEAQEQQQQQQSPAPVGMPIRLAPSSAAFRKSASTEGTAARHGPGMLNLGVGGEQDGQWASGVGTGGGGKGVIGQMSDLIFGW